MAGTIPTVVSYGIEPAAAGDLLRSPWPLICAVVGTVTGSSWTTAGTLGVAFVGMAPILGMSTTIAAGAVISGAYMGDKMSPLSETTCWCPSLVGGVTVNEHIRGMIWTVVPVVRPRARRLPRDRAHRRAVRRRRSASTRPATPSAEAFNISPVNLLPLVLLIVAHAQARSRRSSPSSPSPCSPASSPASPSPTSSRPSSTSPARASCSTASRRIYKSHGQRLRVDERQRHDRRPVLRGGMSSMLTTVWLILGALSFAAIMEEPGFLDRLIAPVVRRARTDAGADRLGRRHLHRAQRRGRRPVRRRRAAEPGVPHRRSPAAASPPACCRARWRTPAP